MTEQTTTDGEEVEWLKEQFNPAQHVPKGTWVKMQIARGNRERGDEVRAEHERIAEAQRERVAAQRARIDEMKSHAAHDLGRPIRRLMGPTTTPLPLSGGAAGFKSRVKVSS